MTSLLIADDHPLFRAALRQTLTGTDGAPRVEEAGDLAALGTALEADRDCDLVLLDLNMPVMNGIEFLRHLRQEPGGEGPAVVFCTVENDLERIREALDAGAREYIMKPFDGDIIASKFAEAGLV